MRKRAYDCLYQYIFPPKIEYVFAFYHRNKLSIPPEKDGWNLVLFFKLFFIISSTIRRLSTVEWVCPMNFIAYRWLMQSFLFVLPIPKCLLFPNAFRMHTLSKVFIFNNYLYFILSCRIS